MNIYINEANSKFLKTLQPGQSMSGLINGLLNAYREDEAYTIFPLREKDKKPKLKIVTEKEPEKSSIQKLLDTPGIVRASEIEKGSGLKTGCKGTHFMSRADCGKPGCPWSFLK